MDLSTLVAMALDSERARDTPVQLGARPGEHVVFKPGFADFAATMLGAKLAAIAALWRCLRPSDPPIHFRRATAGDVLDGERRMSLLAAPSRLVAELLQGYLVADAARTRVTARNLGANAFHTVEHVTVAFIVAPPEHRDALAIVLAGVADGLAAGARLDVARAALPVAVEMSREGSTAALELLGALRDPAGLPALYDALTGADALAVAAALALGHFGDPDAIEALVSIADDAGRAAAVRAAATGAIATIETEAGRFSRVVNPANLFRL